MLAQRTLLAARRDVARRPRGQLLHPHAASTGAALAPCDGAWVERIATAVDRVARFGLFRPTCLVRAVALERLLRDANAGDAAVRVGVHRHDDQLLAHAWIELDGRVVGDDPSFVRRFVPLHDFSALPR